MQIFSSDKFSIYDNTHKNRLELPANSRYIVKSLGARSDRYNFTIPYENGHYYARLHHLSSGKNNKTSVVLIAPQLASDSTSPVISLSDAVRVPVYATERLSLKDIVTELSSYSVEIDEDTSVDADGNGVFDDDFTSNRSYVTISEQEIII